MKHLQGLNTPANKLANTLRLSGIYLITIAGVGFISYRPDSASIFDIYTFFLVVLFFLGCLAAIAGEVLWKMVITYTDVTVRRFYGDDETEE